ncbi:MAG: pyruvate synthase [Elusimicrobia bacterium]|nr:pyruvate synthase [Elusimicrobiota bacterium]MBD3411795.1 pyruvate synthase [Elusimicrobiota bacterium]
MTSIQSKKKILEIRWHGRGGQGAKTAALLLADAVLGAGKHIQAFPEYGPERMGAPVQSYNRISDEPITLHCGITSPDIVIVLDSSLIDVVDVTHGLADDGMILVNTSLSAERIKKKLGIEKQKVFVVNASQIAKEAIGRNIPNTPMLGALIGITKLLEKDAFIADTRAKLEKKFKSKPEIIDGNIQAIERAMKEVLG